MIKDEFKFIRRNKLIMLSVIVIMFIPFLYAIFFLKSVWDPYGDTQSLPVAVVNNDVPVDYEGKTLDVGAQTVKKLKHNDQLGWQFVSASKAADGLKHNKYYTVVTIPKNFSKHAATVLDAHPKKMQLKYTTNDSLNYLSQVISGIGVDKLDKQIRANVTNAYASAVFDQIKTVGKGFSKAASGATQLSDGTATLDDGVSQYTVGVSKVNKGVQTLKVSVKPLTSGVQQLADGGNQLKAGVGPLTSGVQQLANGGNQLKDGVGPLAAGATQLVNGATALKTGTSQLNASVTPLADGVTKLSNGSQDLAQGVKDYTDGTTTLVAGVKQLQVANTKGDATTKTPAINSSIAQIAKGSTDLNSGAGAYVAGVNQSFNTIRGGITQIQAGVKTNTEQAAVTSKQITADMTQLTLLAKLKYGKDAQLNQAVADLTAQLKTLSTQQANSTANLNAGLQAMAAGLSTQNPDFVKLTAGATQLTEGAKTLATGATALNTGYKTFTAGLNQAAAGGDQLLANNAKLNAGASQLNGGLTELNGKIPALSAGVSQLDDGAGQLQGGLTQLNNKVPALTSGVNQLSTGLNTLNGKTPALASGVNQLATGLNTLNSKTPALASGVNQLADGTSQLADKSAQLTDGTGKLKDGSKTLATSLSAGAKQVNGIKLTNETAKMFAAPTHTTQKHYSYVSNYGHALAPYVLSLALYVGAIVFNFAYPIRKVSHADGTPTQWFASKVVLGGLVAVGMAVIEASLIMIGGLTVDHVGLFYAFAIVFSLTSMYFVMMLSMAFDNPGRFVAMIMLMLQLGGAGGTFPLEITNGFYNAIHPFLPMSYSVLGFRQAITSGIYSGSVANCFAFLIGFAILSLLLLWVAMQILQKRHLMGVSQLDNNQKLQDVEK
jgi:putative membrane protein